METLKCIETRRSIRKFLDKPVEKDIIEKLVTEAQYTPTWKNTQTTRFTAVTDKAVLKEIEATLVSFNAAVLASTPLLMAVSVVPKRSAYEKDGTPSTIYGDAYTYFDCGATAQTFCLAANDLGIGTVILGVFDPIKIKAILQIPENEDLPALIACGYHELDAQMPKRRPLEEILKMI
jgi:nitroreductase